jgi:hypothetical protein
MWLKVNGETMQSSNSSNLHYKIPFLLSYVSQFMTLLPGDIISTGTPPGVGLGMDPPVYLKAGDLVELGIDQLGSSAQKGRRLEVNLEVEGKVAVVTGGAKGIGAAIVKSFHAEGATVAILDRNPDIAHSLIEEIGADEKKVFCIPTELTEESACKEAIAKIIETTGRIDYLIHNAGTNDGVGLGSPT